MAAYYLLIKQVHVGSVLISVALFLLRGGLTLGGVDWRRSRILLYLPHLVDTVLLTSALLLTTILHQYPFAHGWLTAKVIALVVYVVLGSYALKRARTRAARAVFLGLALLTFLYIVSVARAHHPLGFIALMSRFA
jgi:uncharacterized membrane protein SirB2